MKIEEVVEAAKELERASEDTIWGRHRNSLRTRLIHDDLNAFCNWSTVVATMFVGDVPFVSKEFAELRNADDWARWELALRETGVGSPPILPYHTSTSANRVHQCYHLYQFEKHTERHIEDFEGPIVEFGGGYGLMCAIIRSLGYKGEYIIYDLPEFSLLQQFYLDGIPATFRYSDERGRFDVPPRTADILIALFSLSECPVEHRNAFLMSTMPANALIGFQDSFDGVDNKGYFDKNRTIISPVTRIFPSPHVSSVNYLIGWEEDDAP